MDEVQPHAQDVLGQAALPDGMLDMLEQAAENVRLEDLRFQRHWYFVAASILAWVAFWQLADRNAQHAYAQVLAWTAVFVAIWIASEY